jgi:hypothetical protein
MGAEGTFERLFGWQAPFEPEPAQAAVVETEAEGRFEPADEPQSPLPVEEETEDDWDVEPDDMWEGDPEPEEEPELETTLWEGEGEEEVDAPTTEHRETESSRITDWAPEEGAFVLMDEGTEPPPKQTRSGGFSGLMGRSRQVSDQIPIGADKSTPIIESLPPSLPPTPLDDPKPKPMEPDERGAAPKAIDTSAIPIDERPVFASEGELWTVDSDLEETLPEISANPPESESYEAVEPVFEEIASDSGNVYDLTPTSAPASIASRWESADALNETHLGSMSDAERLVTSIAGQREVSPSDPEIQARLEVGRPRLSQIYNALQRSGILLVRKEGRSRLFKLSEAAAEMLQ